MINSRIYGYARVSSKEQNEERQIKSLIENGVEERFIFVDKQSGKDFNRSQYQVLKNALRENDVLVIKSIDRLGRNYNMIIEEWRDITKNIKADIKIIDLRIINTDRNKELLGTVISDIVLGLLSYVAEQERTFIKQRQKEGINNAMNNGVKFGRPRIKKPENFDEVVDKWKKKEIKAIEAMKILDLRTNSFYNLLKNRLLFTKIYIFLPKK